MMTSSKAILPDVPEMKDGWRVACIAYRCVRQKGGGDLSAVHRFPLRLVHAEMNGISPVKCANLRCFAFIPR